VTLSPAAHLWHHVRTATSDEAPSCRSRRGGGRIESELSTRLINSHLQPSTSTGGRALRREMANTTNRRSSVSERRAREHVHAGTVEVHVEQARRRG